MKKRKILALAGVTLLTAGFLVACSSGSKTDSAQKSFGYVYAGDPDTLDYVSTDKASTHDIMTNTIEGLLENDKYGNLIPAAAEDWSVSKDGLTYTYKIRKDAKWYTSEGEEYAAVTAHDFVTGLKHAVEKKSGSLYLVRDSIKGLDAYIKGESKDFSTVGVKAVDDNTLEYTLNKPEPYWNSKTTSSILWPVNEEFLKNQGDKYGQATDVNSALYNGPFLLKSITAKSAIEFEKNPNYWDKDNVNVDKVKLSFYTGQDQDSLARNFKEGAYSYARLYPTSSNFATFEKEFKENIYTSLPGSGVGAFGINIDRQSYNHTAKTTDQEKESTKKALLNKDFRQSLNFAFDRESYSAQVNGKEGASLAIRNLFVPSEFVQVGDKTFSDVVESKLTSYGDEWQGVKLADSQNGLYNPEKAKAEFAKAKAALEAEGVQFPIRLDVPVVETSTNLVSRMQSFKQSVENALGKENVTVDLLMMSEDDVYNITYHAPNAAAEDWDLSGVVGWNPDYQDPSTYLDILKSTSSDNTKTWFGFDSGSENAAAKQAGFDEYNQLVDEAGAETSDLVKRYEKYAAAQAWMTDSSLMLPTMASTGAGTFVSRLEPFSGAYGLTGNKGNSNYYKYIKVGTDPITKKDYEKAYEKWHKEKTESNEKAQKELEKRVK